MWGSCLFPRDMYMVKIGWQWGSVWLGKICGDVNDVEIFRKN